MNRIDAYQNRLDDAVEQIAAARQLIPIIFVFGAVAGTALGAFLATINSVPCVTG